MAKDKNAYEVDGLAAAVARADLGAAELASAAAWIKSAVARSIAQLEPDDIDGASLKARLRTTAWTGPSLLCVCLRRLSTSLCTLSTPIEPAESR